ncbi:2'-5' RNA ligase family protein [Robiginitalea aurantiaca]|uniref:2'-5' RNA ligase family protein n=1 Tax=Robiginitalea aurantiaca TaxID=3056915 RepID=A0ABT7WEB0_9FLAO|nr:2'-5' RNA ligase family protein [Robiginitalea aurantiaca]MDM9631264.1 2'-5' RNA ligase family protein [Robiginitalea aurantiaca]
MPAKPEKEIPEIKKQYFIGLVPNSGIMNSVHALKTEIRDRFGAAHALKSPAHITLQMPFHKLEAEEPRLITCLREFASREMPFHVTLDGFDCFPPRVLFVKIRDHLPLQELQARLKAHLISELGFPSPSKKRVFHPHMTIATRDLKEADFEQAWSEFNSRNFQDSFNVSSLFLLKHNGKFWDIYREFPYHGILYE